MDNQTGFFRWISGNPNCQISAMVSISETIFDSSWQVDVSFRWKLQRTTRKGGLPISRMEVEVSSRELTLKHVPQAAKLLAGIAYLQFPPLQEIQETKQS